ncbi:MAG TPA: hypothetical protein VHB99_17435, partial [Pirellulales bacterium]|nr:hypothetical protein [Pirellulales bacterium]
MNDHPRYQREGSALVPQLAEKRDVLVQIPDYASIFSGADRFTATLPSASSNMGSQVAALQHKVIAPIARSRVGNESLKPARRRQAKTVSDFFLRFVDEGHCFMSNRRASAARGCCRERVQSEQPELGSSSAHGSGKISCLLVASPCVYRRRQFKGRESPASGARPIMELISFGRLLISVLIAVSLVFGIVIGVLAMRKGYSFAAWLGSGGLVLLSAIALGFLPDLRDPSLSDSQREKLRAQGNLAGFALSMFTLALAFLSMLS